MDKRQVISSLLLGLAAFIWGSAFVAQSIGMKYTTVGKAGFITALYLQSYVTGLF